VRTEYWHQTGWAMLIVAVLDEDDGSFALARLDVTVGFGGLFQGKTAIDDGGKFPGLDEALDESEIGGRFRRQGAD